MQLVWKWQFILLFLHLQVLRTWEIYKNAASDWFPAAFFYRRTMADDVTARETSLTFPCKRAYWCACKHKRTGLLYKLFLYKYLFILYPQKHTFFVQSQNHWYISQNTFFCAPQKKESYKGFEWQNFYFGWFSSKLEKDEAFPGEHHMLWLWSASQFGFQINHKPHQPSVSCDCEWLWRLCSVRFRQVLCLPLCDLQEGKTAFLS